MVYQQYNISYELNFLLIGIGHTIRGYNHMKKKQNLIPDDDSHVPENLLIEYPYETYITCVQINMHAIEDRP